MDDYDAYDAILHHIFRVTQGDAWFKPMQENLCSGVALRVDTNHFRCFPYENLQLVPFEQAVRVLNPVVAVKVRNAAVHAALANVSDDAAAIHIDRNTRIQILDTMSLLPRADKEQCGAFIRDERVLIIWSDDLDTIVPIFKDFDAKLIKLVFSSRASTIVATSVKVNTPDTSTFPSPSGTASDVNLAVKEAGPTLNKKAEQNLKEKQEGKKKTSSSPFWNLFSWKLSTSSDAGVKPDNADLEKGFVKSPRPIRLFAPVYGGIGAGLSVFFIASGLDILLQEHKLDGSYARFALLVCSPFLFCVSLFFSLQVVTNISFLIGPVAQFHENSRYYSAVKPVENPEVDKRLPHVTIQIPVYKESLEEVIAPSVFSLKKAMQTYARQGGTSSIIVNEDGLQIISPEEREKRKAFYANHNIGWVARPKHDSSEGGYKRAGRFKKASNMNYGLDVCLKLEECLKKIVNEEREREENGEEPVKDESGKSLEDRALDMALDMVYEESGRNFRGWGANGKSLRIGEIILICDSDTIVPEDCFRDAARELAECPEVAIIQHESDVMQVDFQFFENGIAHFTRRINKCISMGCANGEVAPFVGHNAFLRWSAIQDAAFIDEADGKKKCWSESNVSEDFDMALRLQLQGYIIRWASYSNGGFKEGVSLTVDDELNRWQKYSYGCNELIFHPLIHWWRKGPITKQLRTFLWSSAPIHYKITMMAYMFSYYGIAASASLSIVNYLILGWALDIDGYYMHSFEIFLACTVVFPGAGNAAFTLLEYRLGQRDIINALIENLTWVPFFFFFFGGLSIHLSIALLAHLFSYDIQWGATKKEVERSNFFVEVPKIWKRFRGVIVVCFLMAVGMVILSTPLVTSAWQIPGLDWAVILPLAVVIGSHILFPIVLNPWLMIFSY